MDASKQIYSLWSWPLRSCWSRAAGYLHGRHPALQSGDGCQHAPTPGRV